MNTLERQLKRMQKDLGFIAALDQSGGSTPKALSMYGIPESAYQNEEQMYDLIHEMRTRVMTNPSFSGDKILGVILFEKTLNSKVENLPTTEYLKSKNILSFLKIDKGLEERINDVQLMKPIPGLAEKSQEARHKGIFGTKMRSVIYANNPSGIASIVEQQFAFAKVIFQNGLIPIIEPEVDIHAADREAIEATLKHELLQHLHQLHPNELVMLKLSLPQTNNFYAELIQHPKVIRLVALSGGFELEKATELLSKNKGMIASFSRALLDDLRVHQTTKEFTDILSTTIDKIYKASIT